MTTPLSAEQMRARRVSRRLTRRPLGLDMRHFHRNQRLMSWASVVLLLLLGAVAALLPG